MTVFKILEELFDRLITIVAFVAGCLICSFCYFLVFS